MRRGADDAAEADEADDPAAVVDHGEVPEAAVEHHLGGLLDVGVAGGRDRILGHPLSHARLARVDAGGHRLQQVALGDDADQPTEVLDHGSAHVERRHPLGDLAQRVLGSDLDEVGPHDV